MNGNKEGGRELAGIRSLSELGYMRLYLWQHRKQKHHHKLATKENNESELVSVGGWGGRSIL